MGDMEVYTGKTKNGGGAKRMEGKKVHDRKDRVMEFIWEKKSGDSCPRRQGGGSSFSWGGGKRIK